MHALRMQGWQAHSQAHLGITLLPAAPCPPSTANVAAHSPACGAAAGVVGFTGADSCLPHLLARVRLSLWTWVAERRLVQILSTVVVGYSWWWLGVAVGCS